MKLLDQVRHVIRKRHYSIRTEQAYTDWIKRFILFHGKKHPKDMGEIVFLYKQVLKRELGDFGSMERAKRPKRLPTVLTRAVWELKVRWI